MSRRQAGVLGRLLGNAGVHGGMLGNSCIGPLLEVVRSRCQVGKKESRGLLDRKCIDYLVLRTQL